MKFEPATSQLQAISISITTEPSSPDRFWNYHGYIADSTRCINIIPNYITLFAVIRTLVKGGGGGGGGVQAYHFGKKYFEQGVGGEGQDTSQQFEGIFGSIRAILPT